MNARPLALLLGSLLWGAACEPRVALQPDGGGPPDGGEGDSGLVDAGVADASVYDAGPGLTFLIGTDPWGVAHHAPADWPADAGRWNAVNAIYNPATNRIAFHVHRQDIVGGSIRPDGGITAYGVAEYFQAGPQTGTWDQSDTSEVYLANPDGTGVSCLTCLDVVDGQDGAEIYKVLPASSSAPNLVIRQSGATVHANQNKDLPAWYPDGTWVLMGVEMPRHALTHFLGSCEVGYFNDLWAVSPDGKVWVQLTDYANTWAPKDSVAQTPFACAEPHCPAGCQYAGRDSGTIAAPFDAYSCSAVGAPPPASGTMRPVVSHGMSGTQSGSAKVVWAERVGMNGTYTWAGLLQLAKADVLLTGGHPTLVNYRSNLTPTAAAPSGQALWANPGGKVGVGAGYEPWSFSADDSQVGVATDAFHSTSSSLVTYGTFPGSEAFTDATAWGWADASASFDDTTRFDPFVYPYADNAAAPPANKYGHWEETALFSDAAAPIPYMAFGSSANLSPPWNPSASHATFGLETWVMRQDRASVAVQLTHFNSPAAHFYAYPTSATPSGQLYLSVVPAGANPPGEIYTLVVPPL